MIEFERSPEDEKAIENLTQYLDAINADMLELDKQLDAVKKQVLQLRSKILDMRGKAQRAQFGVLSFTISKQHQDYVPDRQDSDVQANLFC